MRDWSQAPVLIACAAILLVADAKPVTAQESVAGRYYSAAALPNLGDGTDMTPSAERRIGDRIARELYRDPDYVDDAILQEYVDAIWRPLLAAARLRGDLPPDLDEAYAWEILLARDRTVNAFALPGAYFGLHLGLIGVVTSRDELASVLAHELSHVTQRHIARSLARQGQQAPWLLGAMILGVLAASKSGNSGNATSAANAMIVGGQAIGAQSQLNFSRDMEREADRMGFAVATQAGFAPDGFVTMFGKLSQASRLNDSGNFPYLRSHPLSTERMADMQSRLDPAPQTESPSGTRRNVSEMDQAMLGARARVIANGSVGALRTAIAQGQDAAQVSAAQTQRAGALYGACLASMKLREFAQAQSFWSQLSTLTKADPPAARQARLLGVELALIQGLPAQAAALLGAVAPSTPAERRTDLFLAAQIGVQRAAKGLPQPPLAVGERGLETVVQQLQTWVAEHPRDAQAWQYLASAYEVQGRTLSAIRAQGEVSAAHLDFSAALARFRAAQDWVRKNSNSADHFEASIVDTRARQVESTVREQALER